MKNKKIWWFLLRFLGSYFVLFLLYSVFLLNTQINGPTYVCDPLTQNVAKQATGLLSWFQDGVVLRPDGSELSVNIWIQKQYVVGIIEGCNAVSIIILFVAFIIAFRGAWKKTVVYACLGAFSIYYVNILRITLLTYGMHHYPSYTWLFHDIVFPAIIYGYVFVLWIVWVNYFSNLKKKKHA